MSIELVDKETPVTNQELIEALWYAWLHVFGSVPKKEAIWILMSQWALETGWGKYMHNYNLGNAKSRDGDGYDYSFYECGEIFTTKYSEQLQKTSPQTAKIKCYRANGTCIIYFYPKHPCSRFRAFNTLLEGAIDHITLVFKRFNQSWPALMIGDPDVYATALKSQGYFTADLHTPDHKGYADTLCSLFHTVSNIKFDYDNLSNINDNDKERLSGLVALSMQQSIDEYMQIMVHPEYTDPDLNSNSESNV